MNGIGQISRLNARRLLIPCPLYKDLRKKYVKKNYWKSTIMLKFILLYILELNTSENEQVINELSNLLINLST
mgnify:CR=1 FL=1